MNAMQYEALAEQARAVYEEATEQQCRAQQAARAVEEAERQQAEQQAQERFEQAFTLLEEHGLPTVVRPWMRRLHASPGSLDMQLQLPEPFGCGHCDWQITLRDTDLTASTWYGIAGCKGIDTADARSGWLPPERFVRWLLFHLEASRREHARWQELVAEDQAAHAELAQRQAELVARVCPWPEGKTVTLYQVHYVRGVALTEEGEHWLEESGWCRTDQVEDGYLTVEATAGRPARRLKLDPHLHRPLFERHEFTSPAELPWELTELSEEQIRGFRYHWELGRQWLLRDPAAEEPLPHLFRVPLPWVRELIS